eukprot:scaffold1535_cov105-Pinguiococcus_pyrenoidosus.AAC.1
MQIEFQQDAASANDFVSDLAKAVKDATSYRSFDAALSRLAVVVATSAGLSRRFAQSCLWPHALQRLLQTSPTTARDIDTLLQVLPLLLEICRGLEGLEKSDPFNLVHEMQRFLRDIVAPLISLWLSRPVLISPSNEAQSSARRARETESL